MLKRFLKRWPLLGLLVIALGVAGGCVADKIANNAVIVMEELNKSSAPTGTIEHEGEILVYSVDMPELVGKVNSMALETDKEDAVKDYLVLQERIDCVLDNVEEAERDDTTVRCHGRILVAKEGEHGLLSVSEMLAAVNTRESMPAKREYLSEYLIVWDETQEINHVTDSLAQIKRTNAIPMVGSLIRSIHNFPIMYEGEELVPKKDVSDLLDEFRSRDTEEARRSLVKAYLEQQPG